MYREGDLTLFNGVDIIEKKLQDNSVVKDLNEILGAEINRIFTDGINKLFFAKITVSGTDIDIPCFIINGTRYFEGPIMNEHSAIIEKIINHVFDGLSFVMKLYLIDFLLNDTGIIYYNYIKRSLLNKMSNDEMKVFIGYLEDKYKEEDYEFLLKIFCISKEMFV